MIRIILILLVAISLSYSLELRWDDGNPYYSWYFPQGYFVVVDFDVPVGTWYLTGIKYCISTIYPESIMQGFEIRCWKLQGEVAGELIYSGYNSNLNGVQLKYDYRMITHNVVGQYNLSRLAPNGFAIGLGFIGVGSYRDAITVDDMGVGKHDWVFMPPDLKDWQAAPCGQNIIRAIISNTVTACEPASLGSVRSLYR